MYTFKSIARRGTLLATAAVLAVAAVLPAQAVFADALNPLTNRSLTLSSSSPGWNFTDGSGNPTYAMPNSGANGKKTGNTFAFNVSTNSSATGTNQPVKAFTFQYCTTSAGDCLSPGNNGWSGSAPNKTRNADSVSGKTSDLNVAASSPSEISNANFATMIDNTTGQPVRDELSPKIPNRNDSQGNFVVMTKDVGDATWSQSEGWSMTATNNETGTVGQGTATGANNFITLTSSTGMALKAGGAVKVIFYGTDGNYITNPGAGAFFVKINDYSHESTFDDTTIVDGGVTVANVMNLSIEIQTKVLETMDFSVGVVDPYTLDSTGGVGSQLHTASGKTKHGQCDPILPGMTQNPDKPNILQMGDQAAENSLSTSATYSTHSYWRLSSNSSAGATVYYSGVTLKNTVNDEIRAIGTTPSVPLRGTPQFGLALTNGKNSNNATGPYTVDYTKEDEVGKGLFENGVDSAVAGVHSSVAGDVALLTGYHAPKLYPLVPEPAYDQGAGIVNGDTGQYTDALNGTAEFAFDPTSNLIPTPIATENNQVVDCVTAKVRYIANIAATTPAGIYTTKINWIAAPQY